MKTLEDWKDAYYEQQALHTEETGMLQQEINSLKSRIANMENDAAEITKRYAAYISPEEHRVAVAGAYGDGYSDGAASEGAA